MGSASSPEEQKVQIAFRQAILIRRDHLRGFIMTMSIILKRMSEKWL
jgi:hypothetical protein